MSGVFWRVRSGLMKGKGLYYTYDPEDGPDWTPEPSEAEAFQTWEIAQGEVCSGLGDCRVVRCRKVQRRSPQATGVDNEAKEK